MGGVYRLQITQNALTLEANHLHKRKILAYINVLKQEGSYKDVSHVNVLTNLERKRTLNCLSLKIFMIIVGRICLG